MATGAGALAYAGAAHEWNGKSETSVPKPTMSNAAMLFWVAGSMVPAALTIFTMS